MKKIIVTLILLLIFSVGVNADVYSEQYENSGAEALDGTLSQETRHFFEERDISLKDSGWVNKLTVENVFSYLWDSLENTIKTPVTTALVATGLSLAVAVLRLFSSRPESESTLSFTAVAAVAGVALLPLFSAVAGAAETLKNAARFMLSFIPVYCGITVASGRPMTGAVSGGIMVLSGETVVWLASNVILPLVGAFLSVMICGSLSPAVELTPLGETLKKCATWVTGLLMTLYVGILGLQSTVNAAADNLALRTGKFLIGSFIPVVGSPVSEALNTVQASVSLLRSSVGIYGVVAVAVTVLPTALWLGLWRVCLLLSSAAAGILDCKKISALLKACDAAVSFTLGMTLICSVAFIISLAVLASAGG